MKSIALSVQAISPLAIRSDHAPGGAETTKYIPGTALTGSLAAIYRLYHQDDEENFERLFLI
jgi:CRISPR-associated protein Csx10